MSHQHERLFADGGRCLPGPKMPEDPAEDVSNVKDPFSEERIRQFLKPCDVGVQSASQGRLGRGA